MWPFDQKKRKEKKELYSDITERMKHYKKIQKGKPEKIKKEEKAKPEKAITDKEEEEYLAEFLKGAALVNIQLKELKETRTGDSYKNWYREFKGFSKRFLTENDDASERIYKSFKKKYIKEEAGKIIWIGPSENILKLIYKLLPRELHDTKAYKILKKLKLD